MAQFRILIVENDDIYRAALAARLRDEGYAVREARSPAEAREILESELIHLASVDIRLLNDDDRNDDSGLALCRELDATVAKIIVTGYPEWDLVRQALQPQNHRGHRADGFFSKAEDPEEFLKIIREVLREQYDLVPDARYAVLTSGGDSPGMNAAIWAFTRKAMRHSVEVLGVRDGYRGLAEGDIRKLRWSDVSGIMNASGTFLGSSRYLEFRDPAVREKAVEILVRKHVTGLLVIGGDGSMQGAQALSRARQGRILRTVALPGTIDNDLFGTDISLGADSAANAMITELRHMIAPARALRRVFVVEVMGRYAGYLAEQAALGVGADAVMVTEDIVETYDGSGGAPVKEQVDQIRTLEDFLQQLETVAERLRAGFAAGNRHGFVILAEGLRLLTGDDIPTRAETLLANLTRRWPEKYRADVRSQTLGYTVRGVPPTREDIRLGAMLGASAVGTMLGGRGNVMLGWKDGAGVVETPFDTVCSESAKAPRELLAARPGWKELLQLQRDLAEPPSPLPLP